MAVFPALTVPETPAWLDLSSQAIVNADFSPRPRLLPGWHQPNGHVWLYYPRRDLLPAKTRVFIDFVLERFQADGFAQRMRAD